MRLSIQTGIMGIIIILIGINVAIFIQGIKLSKDIHYYESEISKLKQQNIEYEQAIYKVESYAWTASLAAELEYGKYNDPIYIQPPQYAQNQ